MNNRTMKKLRRAAEHGRVEGFDFRKQGDSESLMFRVRQGWR